MKEINNTFVPADQKLFKSVEGRCTNTVRHERAKKSRETDFFDVIGKDPTLFPFADIVEDAQGHQTRRFYAVSD